MITPPVRYSWESSWLWHHCTSPHTRPNPPSKTAIINKSIILVLLSMCTPPLNYRRWVIHAWTDDIQIMRSCSNRPYIIAFFLWYRCEDFVGWCENCVRMFGVRFAKLYMIHRTKGVLKYLKKAFWHHCCHGLRCKLLNWSYLASEFFYLDGLNNVP